MISSTWTPSATSSLPQSFEGVSGANALFPEGHSFPPLVIAVKGRSEEIFPPSGVSGTSSPASCDTCSSNVALNVGPDWRGQRRASSSPQSSALALDSLQGLAVREARPPGYMGPELFWHLSIGHQPLFEAHLSSLSRPPPQDQSL